jgi:hypothetical protein
MLFSQSDEQRAMFGEEGFIRGDNMFAVGKSRFNNRFGGSVRPANQFDDAIDRRRGGELDRIIKPFDAR